MSLFVDDAWATISDDGLYRYDLGRAWGAPDDLALWAMLNPSTADGLRDDPTIRRVRGFSRAWGRGGFVVVNLFALRATKPVHLLDHPDPTGPENVATIRRWLSSDRVSLVVCAWGSGFRAVGLPRFNVEGAARDAWHKPVCLGKTADGSPRHPLYVPAATEPVPFP